MNGAIVVFIIGATVSISMFFAYLSTKVKAQAEVAAARRENPDAPTREEVEALQQQVGELAERVDFAERMLAQRRDPERLVEPRQEGRS